MAAKKPEVLFETPKVTCAGNPVCRFPGRLWHRGLPTDQRVCVIHYYQAVDADPDIYRDDVVPPKMSVQAKPVAGDG